MVVSVPARALTVSLVATGAWFDGSVFAGADWPSQNPPVAAVALPGDPVRPSPATRVTAVAAAIFCDGTRHGAPSSEIECAAQCAGSGADRVRFWEDS